MLKWIPGIGFASLTTAVWIVGVALWAMGAFVSFTSTARMDETQAAVALSPVVINAVLIAVAILGVWILVPVTRVLTPARPGLNALLFVGVAGLPCLGFLSWPLFLWAAGAG